MSYVLFLGFKSTIYKNPVTIRVSLDNIFLDEFSLVPIEPCNFNYFFYQSEEYMSWVKKNSNDPNNLLGKDLPKEVDNYFHKDIIFHIMELDKKVIDENKNHNLVVELMNTSNNYTNGFITKSTLTSFYIAHLVPRSILIDSTTFCDSFVYHLKNYRSKQNNTYTIAKSYKTKCELFDLLKKNVSKDSNENYNLKWYNHLNEDVGSVKWAEWCGSKGYFKLYFDTELVNGSLKNVGDYTVKRLELEALSNKYKQYANL